MCECVWTSKGGMNWKFVQTNHWTQIYFPYINKRLKNPFFPALEKKKKLLSNQVGENPAEKPKSSKKLILLPNY